MATLRQLIFYLSIIGCLACLAAFITSLLNPAWVEQLGKQVIRYQVEKSTHEKIEALDQHFLVKRAMQLNQGYAKQVQHAKLQLQAKVPERIASVISEMRNLDCECRKKIERSIHDSIAADILNATQAQQHLTNLVREQYMETSSKLNREFRIFTGTNAVVFALLALAVWAKRKANVQLLPAALVLMLAAVITGYLYIFQQNWLHTLLFNDYLGLGYIAYLGVCCAFLSDIFFNRARITARVLSALMNALGSAVTVLPC